MELQAANSETNQVREGIHAGITIAIGYFPIALTFGILAKSGGLSMFETVLMSVVVYAGASQYIALSLLSLGTSTVEIILTTFILNIRHFLMSTTLQTKSEQDVWWKKSLYAFGITDETFSVAAIKQGTLSSGYMFGLGATAYTSWFVFSGIGYLFGSSLPQTLQESMAIALYAMFIGLLVPSIKGSRKVLFLAVLGACLNTAFLKSGALQAGWSIIAATLCSATVVELVVTLRVDKKAGEGV